MNVYIDIETLPSPDRDAFIQDARDNFKAPSTLTKGQAGADLGITGNDLKFASADDIKARWEKEMASVKADEVGDEKWRRTALDGTYGRVLAIGYKVDRGETKVVYCYSEDEAGFLMAAFSEIMEDLESVHDQASKRKPVFIGHNVVFDLKFLFRRAAILNVKPPFDLPFQGRHENSFYCTSKAWCEFKEYISLDNLCKALGIPGKDGFDGSMVYDAWANGEHDKIREYCADDVNKVVAIHKRLTFSE